jgi:hypothetical protein
MSLSQVAAMQRDSNTYLDEPEDVEDFETWMSSFRYFLQLSCHSCLAHMLYFQERIGIIMAFSYCPLLV